MPATTLQSDSADSRQVVVLCPSVCDGAEFRAAVSAAAQNAARVAVVRDAVAAMMELHRGAQQLIVPWPAKTSGLGELLAAAARYFPLVACVDAAGLPLVGASVSPTTVESSHAHTTTDDSVPDAGASAAVGGRTSAKPEPAPASSWTSPAAIASPRRPLMAPEDLLTDEELAMLMGPIREG